MYICTYVYVYTCLYVCMYTCIYVYTYMFHGTRLSAQKSLYTISQKSILQTFHTVNRYF